MVLGLAASAGAMVLGVGGSRGTEDAGAMVNGAVEAGVGTKEAGT